jgi:hypothetical protein
MNKISLADATQSTGTWTTTAPSYDFDGNDYINVEGAFDRLETGNTPNTISVWAKQDTDQDNGMIWYAGDGINVNSFSIRNGLDLGYFNSWGTYTQASIVTSTIDTTEWHHYLVTDTGSSAVLYIDGVATSNNSGSVWSATSYDGQLIGDRNISPDKPFDGQISGLKIWNRILSTDEISLLYNREKVNY